MFCYYTIEEFVPSQSIGYWTRLKRGGEDLIEYDFEEILEIYQTLRRQNSLFGEYKRKVRVVYIQETIMLMPKLEEMEEV